MDSNHPIISGRHMNFDVLEVDKNFQSLMAARSTLVDFGEPLEKLKQLPPAQVHLNRAISEINKLSQSSKTIHENTYSITPVIQGFTSEFLSDRDALRIRYRVDFYGDSHKIEEIFQIEEDIYDLINDVEAILKKECDKLNEVAGKNIEII